jgi:hypothetical protein
MQPWIAASLTTIINSEQELILLTVRKAGAGSVPSNSNGIVKESLPQS